MAFIKIDPNKVDTVASNLEERAGAVEEERRNIDNTSSANHDPVPSVVTATEAFSVVPVQASPFGFGVATTFNGAAQGLRDLADELRTRSQEARNLNSSGVTMTNDDGTLSYYLPDPPEGTVDTEAYWNSMDTATNVREYNSKSVENARAESAELVEAIENGKSSKGRTVDEIMAEISKHQDVPTYGLTFVTTWTPEGYLNLQNDLSPEHITVLAHNLASATQNEGSGASLAEMYDEATQGDNTALMTARLNNLLTVPETHFGTEFLVDLAGRLEDRYYESSHQLHPHTSLEDPLHGVLSAMGYNPEAAVNYLMPDWEPPADYTGEDASSPSPAALSRWELLRNRSWSRGESFDAFSTALAGASSLRSPSDTNIDERASWITAQGITMLAEHAPMLTERSQYNTGVILGNCGPELTVIASSGKSGGVAQIDDEEPYQTASLVIPGQNKEPGQDPYVLADQMMALVDAIGSNDDAMSAIGQGTVKYASARGQATADRKTGIAEKQDAIGRAFTAEEELVNFLDERVESKEQAALNGANALATAASLIPGAQIPATLTQAGLSLDQAVSATEARKSVADGSSLDTAPVELAIQNGLIPTEELQGKSWYNPYGGQDGYVDLSDDSTGGGLTREQKRRDFQAWIQAQRQAEEAVLSDDLIEAAADGSR
ncbi:hypothetical protein NSA19_01290 [Actinomyces bowdenii]|uniref:DUF6571 family protein n=1 Tax=Actinomyces bowdenii TaxID=131109 RepID=UPI00214B127C|nr:hypothetical protein [Actinomyces bowdenii]